MKEELKNRKVPVEVWSRCVGYYRPVNQMNPGKQEEVKERKMINLEGFENGHSNVQLPKRG